MNGKTAIEGLLNGWTSLAARWISDLGTSASWWRPVPAAPMTSHARTGSAMFLTCCSPWSLNSASTLPLTATRIDSDTMMPPGQPAPAAVRRCSRHRHKLYRQPSRSRRPCARQSETACGDLRALQQRNRPVAVAPRALPSRHRQQCRTPPGRSRRRYRLLGRHSRQCVLGIRRGRGPVQEQWLLRRRTSGANSQQRPQPR